VAKRTAQRARPRARRPGKVSGPPARASGGDRAARRRGRAGIPWLRSVIVLGVVAAVAAVGIIIQSNRSGGGGAVVRPSFAAADGGVTQGSAGAAVTVVEYGDFQCPNCGRLQRTLAPTIQRLIKQGTLRFRYVPMAFLGPESIKAANAAYCAGVQGRFWQYHDYLFANQAPENSSVLTDGRLVQYGASVGASGSSFEKCVADGTYVPWVNRVSAMAQQRGINATPTLLLNGSPMAATAFTPEGFAAAVAAASR
jgi:protein-disulfide isomerase